MLDKALHGTTWHTLHVVRSTFLAFLSLFTFLLTLNLFISKVNISFNFEFLNFIQIEFRNYLSLRHNFNFLNLRTQWFQILFNDWLSYRLLSNNIWFLRFFVSLQFNNKLNFTVWWECNCICHLKVWVIKNLDLFVIGIEIEDLNFYFFFNFSLLTNSFCLLN